MLLDALRLRTSKLFGLRAKRKFYNCSSFIIVLIPLFLFWQTPTINVLEYVSSMGGRPRAPRERRAYAGYMVG
eukprot:COSAG06_NODE_4585_length_4125_cov_57.362146_5_plen_73_part_00